MKNVINGSPVAEKVQHCCRLFLFALMNEQLSATLLQTVFICTCYEIEREMPIDGAFVVFCTYQLIAMKRQHVNKMREANR